VVAAGGTCAGYLPLREIFAENDGGERAAEIDERVLVSRREEHRAELMLARGSKTLSQREEARCRILGRRV
jgi:hypothetical protein